MLPNTLIIGAQKAASSWLSERLAEHPDVFFYERSEIHFFTANYHRGLRWYAGHFADWSGESVVGEKSTMYLSDPSAPERIYETLGPDVRLIVSVRHPVDRAYSAYWHAMKDGRISSQLSFEAAYEQLPDLKENSLYGAHLERFLQWFDAENLHVIVFEEAVADETLAFRRCLEFLGVDESFVPETQESKVNPTRDVRPFSRQAWRISRSLNRLPAAVRVPMKFVGRSLFHVLPTARQYERLSDEIRSRMIGDFSDDIDCLEELVAREFEIWRSG